MTVNLSLPAVGGDNGQWGNKINAALSELESNANALTTAIAGLGSGYVPKVPTAGSFTYNPDGTVASDPDGTTYAYNADGTLHSETLSGVTRTYSYNADGTIASVA